MRTIEQKNRLIAEFMDIKPKMLSPDTYSYSDMPFFSVIENTPEKVMDAFVIYAKYHSSWDWLMPVIEKIERLGFTIEKNFQPIDNDWQCLVVKGNDILFQEFNEQSIQAMHYVVSEFIEMYNNKNK